MVLELSCWATVIGCLVSSFGRAFAVLQPENRSMRIEAAVFCYGAQREMLQHLRDIFPPS